MTMKTIMPVVAAMAVFVSGCDEIPSEDTIAGFSTAIGKTAGYACELAKMKPQVKEEVVNVLDNVKGAIPKEDETFYDVWTPLAYAEIDKIAQKKGWNETEVKAAKLAVIAATKGIDYVFMKYPKAREVENLVSISVDSFVDGYKSVIAFAANGSPDIDVEAYNYLKAELANCK